MKHIVIFSILTFTSIQTFSQNTITGKVTDNISGERLPAVNVYIPEYQMGTSTNAEGLYTLSGVPNGKFHIQFSYVGYETRVKTYVSQNLQISLDIQMEPMVIHTQGVVISGGSYSSQHENAIKIEVLKPDDLKKSGAMSLAGNLAAIPGVDMISKGNGITTPVIRGLSMNNILVMNNGVKLESFQFSENHPFLLDESGAEQIEIIKGPASLLYGSDAIGGVINVIREKPAPLNQIRGDGSATYFSSSQGVAAQAGIKGNREGIIWGIRGSGKTHRDYTDGNGNRVPNSRFNSKSLKLHTGLIKQSGIFKLFYDYNQDQFGMTTPVVIPDLGENSRKNLRWFQDLDHHLVSSRNNIFIGNQKVDLNASYQSSIRKLYGESPAEEDKHVHMRLQTWSAEVKSQFTLGTSSDLIVSLQGMHKNNQNQDAPEHVLPDATVYDLSGVALWQQTFREKLEVQAGLRYDYRHMDVPEQDKTHHSHGEEPIPAEEEILEALETSFCDVSYSLGATYNLAEDVLLRTNVARAFRTPNLAELTQDGIHETRYEQGDRNLRSQHGLEWDASIHYHKSLFEFDLAAFYNQLDRYIYLSPTEDISEDGDPVYRYSQQDAKIYGAELHVDIVPSSWSQVTGNYAWIHGKQKDGTYLPFIPQNKAGIALTLKKPKWGLLHEGFLKLGLTHAARQKHPSVFEEETPGYTVYYAALGSDIHVGIQILHVSLRVDNLWDKTYIDHLSTLKGLGYYHTGRNMALTLGMEF